jgi:hypothetical protein
MTESATATWSLIADLATSIHTAISNYPVTSGIHTILAIDLHMTLSDNSAIIVPAPVLG